MTQTNTENPQISIVIPAYNAARYISDTLQSILSQDFQDFEIIIIDDFSTDNTRDIVMAYAREKVRYLRLDKQHGGPSRPRNQGIMAAQGKYIAFFDADDIMLPGRLGLAYTILEQNLFLGLTFTNAIKFEDAGGDYPTPFLSGYTVFKGLRKISIGEHAYMINSSDANTGLLYENFILTCGVTVPRSVFDTVGFFDEDLTNADDWDMWLRIVKQYPIAYIDCIGFRYRVRSGSVSRRGARLSENRIKVLRKNLADDLSESSCRQIQRLIAENYINIGYSYQVLGEMATARRYYLASMQESPSHLALKGTAITLLGSRLYFLLKRLIRRNELNRDGC